MPPVRKAVPAVSLAINAQSLFAFYLPAFAVAFPFVYLHSESLGNVQAGSVSQAVVIVTGVFILRHRFPF